MDLSKLGSRVFVLLSDKLATPLDIAKKIGSSYVGKNQVAIVMSEVESNQIDNLIYLHISELNQAFLKVFFSVPNRILITEANAILGQFIVSRVTGQICVIGTEFNSIPDLIGTARFLSGPAAQDVQISPLDILKFYSQIGFQSKPSPKFNYTFLPVRLSDTLKQKWLNEYLKINPGRHVVYVREMTIEVNASIIYSNQSSIKASERKNQIQYFNQSAGTSILISDRYLSTPLSQVVSIVLYSIPANPNILNSYLKSINFTQASIQVISLIKPEDEETYDQLAKDFDTKTLIFSSLRNGVSGTPDLYQKLLNMPNLTIPDLKGIIKPLQMLT